MQWSRLLPLSGAAFVVLVVVAIVGVGGSTPGADASAERLASFYSDNALRQGIGAFVLAAAAPFVVLFGLGLARSLQPREPGRATTWSSVLLAGTVLVAAGVLITAFVHFALANGADEGISPTALEALNALDANTWMVFNPAFGTTMLGAAGVVLAQERLRPAGWIALALGVASFVPFADFFALLGSLLWIAVTGVILARAASRPDARYVPVQKTA